MTDSANTPEPTSTNDLFAALVGDLGDVAEAGKAAEAELKKPAVMKDGIRYAADEQDSNGHQISRYAVVMGGKVIAHVLIDNDLETTPPAGMPKLPAGLTVHAIRVQDAMRTKTLETTGVAVKAPHNDGTGTHIDGQTVASYVGPRVARIIADLYGV
jgi:hypothetical protein